MKNKKPKNSSIKYQLTVFKNGKPIKRESFSQPTLTINASFLRGKFYWKTPQTFLFSPENGDPKQQINAISVSDDTKKATFVYEKNEIKLHLVSILNGAPPPITDISPIRGKKFPIFKSALLALLALIFFLPLKSTQHRIVTPKPVKKYPAFVQKKIRPVRAPKKNNTSLFYQTLRKNKKSIERCQYSHEFKDGLIKYKLLLKPNGKVSNVSVVSEAVSSPKLLDCLNKKIATWTFPHTSGEKHTLYFALSLQMD